MIQVNGLTKDYGARLRRKIFKAVEFLSIDAVAGFAINHDQ